MDIIPRPEARAKGLKTYYTGKICRNGHDSYRYTQSGTCAQCIRDANGGGPVDPTSAARRDAKAQMVQARFRLHDVDRETFAASAWAMGVMRYPVLTLGDIDPHTLPQDKGGGTGLYAFYCHHEDVDTLRKLSMDMVQSHMVEVNCQKVGFVNRVNEYLPPDSTPPINFK